MVRRKCKKCDHIQQTWARVYWKCRECGKRNYIKRPKPIKPFKVLKYEKRGIVP